MVLGAACFALMTSGCASLRNFPGTEGPRTTAPEPPPALRPPPGEPAPSPPVTAQAPPALQVPPPVPQPLPPAVQIAAPPAPARVTAMPPQPPMPTLLRFPAPPASRPADVPLPSGRMPTLPLTQIDDRLLAADLDHRTFALTFAQPVAIQDLLLQLVRGTSLSMIPDPSISGAFIGDLKNATVRQALGVILPPLGLDYAIVGRFIRVFKREPETRLFDINYVATQRTGTAAPAPDAAGGGGAHVSSSTATDLFADLSTGIQGLLSERATFNLDRKAGLLQVIDFPERLDRVAVYLDAVHSRVHRQVQIDVRVVQVELKDAAAQTIDWNAVAQAGTLAAGAVSAPSLTSVRVTDVGRLLTALAGQGKVSTIAGTRILALNNETAIVRATSDLRRGETREAAGEPSVTDGLTVMVTPQIGSDGSVMLSLSPTLTLPTYDSAGNRIGGSVGLADMLARLTDGETIVVSGFGRMLEAGETAAGRRSNGNVRRPTEAARMRSEVLILLTPRILHSTAD
jgi:MSHA biogenesis protein MshL